jgi:hypothetical protein
VSTKRTPLNRPSSRNDYPPPWESRPVSQERWHRRDRMMAAVGAGVRPTEWWAYETEATRPTDRGDETIALYEMGELTEAEIAELMPQWHRYDWGRMTLTTAEPFGGARGYARWRQRAEQ